jgi:hypothetical protein
MSFFETGQSLFFRFGQFSKGAGPRRGDGVRQGKVSFGETLAAFEGDDLPGDGLFTPLSGEGFETKVLGRLFPEAGATALEGEILLGEAFLAFDGEPLDFVVGLLSRGTFFGGDFLPVEPESVGVGMRNGLFGEGDLKSISALGNSATGEPLGSLGVLIRLVFPTRIRSGFGLSEDVGSFGVGIRVDFFFGERGEALVLEIVGIESRRPDGSLGVAISGDLFRGRATFDFRLCRFGEEVWNAGAFGETRLVA